MGEDVPTPLDVILRTMQARWVSNDVEQAVALAKAAAPYVHAKPTGGKARSVLEDLGDDEIDELCKTAADRAACAGKDQAKP